MQINCVLKEKLNTYSVIITYVIYLFLVIFAAWQL